MEEYLVRALQGIALMEVGREFKLRETIPDWGEIPKGDRTKFGTYFRRRCLEGHIPEVRWLEESPQNHQRYVKLQ